MGGTIKEAMKIDLNIIPKIWAEKIVDDMDKELKVLELEYKNEFLEDVRANYKKIYSNPRTKTEIYEAR